MVVKGRFWSRGFKALFLQCNLRADDLCLVLDHQPSCGRVLIHLVSQMRRWSRGNHNPRSLFAALNDNEQMLRAGGGLLRFLEQTLGAVDHV